MMVLCCAQAREHVASVVRVRISSFVVSSWSDGADRKREYLLSRLVAKTTVLRLAACQDVPRQPLLTEEAADGG